MKYTFIAFLFAVVPISIFAQCELIPTVETIDYEQKTVKVSFNDNLDPGYIEFYPGDGNTIWTSNDSIEYYSYNVGQNDPLVFNAVFKYSTYDSACTSTTVKTIVVNEDRGEGCEFVVEHSLEHVSDNRDSVYFLPKFDFDTTGGSLEWRIAPGELQEYLKPLMIYETEYEQGNVYDYTVTYRNFDSSCVYTFVDSVNVPWVENRCYFEPLVKVDESYGSVSVFIPQEDLSGSHNVYVDYGNDVLTYEEGMDSLYYEYTESGIYVIQINRFNNSVGNCNYTITDTVSINLDTTQENSCPEIKVEREIISKDSMNFIVTPLKNNFMEGVYDWSYHHSDDSLGTIGYTFQTQEPILPVKISEEGYVDYRVEFHSADSSCMVSAYDWFLNNQEKQWCDIKNYPAVLYHQGASFSSNSFLINFDEGTYQLDLGDGFISNDWNDPYIGHTYGENGQYVFSRFYMSDDSTCSWEYHDTLVVTGMEDLKCDLKVDSITLSQEGLLEIMFDQTFYGNISFGDEAHFYSKKGNSIQHLYTEEGTYRLLMNTASETCVFRYEDTIVVTDLPEPDCSFEVETYQNHADNSIEFNVINLDSVFDGLFIWDLNYPDLDSTASGYYNYTLSDTPDDILVYNVLFKSDDGNCSFSYEDTVVVEPREITCSVEAQLESSFSSSNKVFEATVNSLTSGSVNWYFESNTVKHGLVVDYQFPRTDTYTVIAEYINNDSSCYAYDTVSVDVFLDTCRVNFDFVQNGNEVLFNAFVEPNDYQGAYSWSFGDGATFTGDRAVHYYQSAHIYDVQLTFTDRYSYCSDTIQRSINITDVPFDLYKISGYVSELDNITVLLYELADEELKLIRSTDTLGSFTFDYLPEGKYVLAVIPSENRNDYLPTYSGNTAVWTNADIITVTDSNIIDYEIQLVFSDQLTNDHWNSGLDSLVGYVFGNNTLQRGGSSLSGSSTLQYAIVQLLDSDGNLLTYTTTDEYGKYSFGNLVKGSYQIKVIYPGRSEAEPINISVDGNVTTTETATNVIMKRSNVVTSTNNTVTGEFNLYPVPVKDVLNIEGNFEKVYVITIDGSIVLQSTSPSISLSHLDSGAYILKIVSEHGTQTISVIKE